MTSRPDRFVVVTGLSGSGKSCVERGFEDLGYFCVDNLPLSLLDPFLDDVRSNSSPKSNVCVVVDVRNPSFAERFPAAFARIRERVPHAELLFLDCSDEALVRRFSESRRPHPLGQGLSLPEALRRERVDLKEVRGMADLVIDTSTLIVHDLRALIGKTFATDTVPRGPVVWITSFGFKNGLPSDLDLLFDVRFLSNPHFVPELRARTGADPEVAAYIEADQEFKPFLQRLVDFLSYLMPQYERENKSYLSVGIGCTGGRHRSVLVANRLAESFKSQGRAVHLRHRDADRE